MSNNTYMHAAYTCAAKHEWLQIINSPTMVCTELQTTDTRHTCTFCHLLVRDHYYIFHLCSAIWAVERSNTYFSSFLLNLPNKCYLLRMHDVHTGVFSMWRDCNKANSNLECWDRIRYSERLEWLRDNTARWRSGTNTSAVTSACWLNTTICTVVQCIWLGFWW